MTQNRHWRVGKQARIGLGLDCVRIYANYYCSELSYNVIDKDIEQGQLPGMTFITGGNTGRGNSGNSYSGLGQEKFTSGLLQYERGKK